jgi:hypothetical protein
MTTTVYGGKWEEGGGNRQPIQASTCTKRCQCARICSNSNNQSKQARQINPGLAPRSRIHLVPPSTLGGRGFPPWEPNHLETIRNPCQGFRPDPGPAGRYPYPIGARQILPENLLLVWQPKGTQPCPFLCPTQDEFILASLIYAILCVPG